jgi:type III pantothenate kinase
MDAISSGVLHGAASMVDGMIQRFRAQLGEEMTVYLTGQYIDLVAERMQEQTVKEPHLALMGLQKIWEKNKKA